MENGSFDFDPTGAVRVHLPSGTSEGSDGVPLVFVPVVALAALDEPSQASVGRLMGERIGAGMLARFGGAAAVHRASTESVARHLAGELALAGLGALELEHWGRAMVVSLRLERGEGDERRTLQPLLGSVIKAALSVATGTGVCVASLGCDPQRARFFVGSYAAVERATALVSGGLDWRVVLAELQRGRA